MVTLTKWFKFNLGSYVATHIGTVSDQFPSDLHTRVGSPCNSKPALHENVTILPTVVPKINLSPLSTRPGSPQSITIHYIIMKHAVTYKSSERLLTFTCWLLL